MLIVGLLIGAAVVLAIYNRDKVSVIVNRIASDLKKKTTKKD